MIIYFLKLKINNEDSEIYNKLRSKIEKDTFYIPIGFMKEKIVGDIDEKKNFFWMRRRGKTLNSFTPTFFGTINKINNQQYIQGYFYINPIFILLYCIFIVLTYASLNSSLNSHSIFMLIVVLLIGAIGVYGNYKDIQIIIRLIEDITGSNIIINQRSKNIVIIMIEIILLICFCLFFIFV